MTPILRAYEHCELPIDLSQRRDSPSPPVPLKEGRPTIAEIHNYHRPYRCCRRKQTIEINREFADEQTRQPEIAFSEIGDSETSYSNQNWAGCSKNHKKKPPARFYVVMTERGDLRTKVIYAITGSPAEAKLMRVAEMEEPCTVIFAHGSPDISRAAAITSTSKTTETTGKTSRNVGGRTLVIPLEEAPPGLYRLLPPPPRITPPTALEAEQQLKDLISPPLLQMPIRLTDEDNEYVGPNSDFGDIEWPEELLQDFNDIESTLTENINTQLYDYGSEKSNSDTDPNFLNLHCEFRSSGSFSPVLTTEIIDSEEHIYDLPYDFYTRTVDAETTTSENNCDTDITG